MSTQTLLDKLKLAVEIVERQLPWQWRDPRDGQWSAWPPMPGTQLYMAIGNGHEIRIKPWTLPPPPEGRQWYKDGWAEKNCPPGWRPFLIGEKLGTDAHIVLPNGETVEQQGVSTWVASHETITRLVTRRPLPSPPVYVPLSASDIPPGSAIRHPEWTKDNAYMMANVARSGVCGMINCNLQDYSFSALQEHEFEILRPGGEWEPCRKLKP